MTSLPGESRGAVFRRGVTALKRAGIPNPALDAGVLMGHVTGEPPAAALLDRRSVLTKGQERFFNSLIQKRCARTSVSRLLGEKEFYSRTFHINGDVLDPRPETEVLVEEAIKNLRGAGGDVSVLDVGTGSGAIAVTVAAEVADARVFASDISLAALKVARRNAERHGVSGRLDCIQADLLDGIRKAGGFTVIVSNPPYIPRLVLENLQEEVRGGDPQISLAAGDEGTEFYPLIARQAVNLLAANGSLLVEVGAGQGERVAGMFRKAGLKKVRIISDLAGRSRVVKGARGNA